MTVPDNVTYGQITGRFTAIVADGSDPDVLPEGIPLARLNVTITSSVSPPMLIDVLADPPQQISLDAFKATTNQDGDLALAADGPAGIWVPASDNPNMGVTYPWTYTVTVSGAPLRSSYSYTFVLPTGSTVDLATVTQVTAQPSEIITQWQAAVDKTTQNVAAAQAIVDTLDLSQYVKTVNGVAPDADGNVVVSGGSGGGDGVTTVNGATGDVTVDASNLPGVTTIGRALLAPVNQAAARTAIGAGTSSLVIGTTAGTAPDAQAVTDALATKATLDGNGLVQVSQLPGFVDDVIEGANRTSFPSTGESGKLYLALDTNLLWRWSGTTYVELPSSPGTTDDVVEGSTNLYFTAARAQAAVTLPTADTLSGATDVGKSLMKAADGAAARAATGAGTSNLVVGTTAGTAADAAATTAALGLKADADKIPTADTLSGATTVGKAVMKAATATDGREGLKIFVVQPDADPADYDDDAILYFLATATASLPTMKGYTSVSSDTGVTNVTIDPSVGTQGTAVSVGDWMFLTYMGSAAVPPTTPTGWVVLADLGHFNTRYAIVYGRVRQAGDTSYNVAIQSNVNGCQFALIWGAGADATIADWLAGAVVTASGSVNNVTAPAVTTTTPSLVLTLAFEASTVNEADITSMSGATKWFFIPQANTGVQIHTLAVGFVNQSSAGATSGVTITYPNASPNIAAVQIALPEAS